MKAVAFYKHGDVRVLRYVKLPTPEIEDDEVLVEVKACALNHLDIWAREGLPGVPMPMPHILGSDVAGYVAKVGMDVKDVRVGQRVVASPGLSCGKCVACLSGWDSRCDQFKILGLQVQGGYAEYVKVKPHDVILVSNRYSEAEWAATPLVFLTAWHMLVTRACLQPGDTVLIQAGGSGIGSAAIQVAKYYHAYVITTVGSDAKAAKAKALGADQVINYRKRDLVKEVKRVTRGHGVSVAFEHIGPQTFEKSLMCLRKGGRLVTCGATTGPKVQLELRHFFARELSIAGCYMGSRRELMTVLGLLDQGILHPVVDSVFPLKDAALAQQKMLSRGFFGKLVLRCAP